MRAYRDQFPHIKVDLMTHFWHRTSDSTGICELKTAGENSRKTAGDFGIYKIRNSCVEAPQAHNFGPTTLQGHLAPQSGSNYPLSTLLNGLIIRPLTIKYDWSVFLKSHKHQSFNAKMLSMIWIWLIPIVGHLYI